MKTNVLPTPITITESANTRIKKMLADSGEEAIRFGIKGGGCSGFTFFLEFDKLSNTDGQDEIIDLGEVKIIVDGPSLMYIIGTTIDWVEDLMGSHFSFSSPTQASKCGCGNSVNFRV